ncbi:MAG: hypothetical protein DHS20C05_08610 [Hyphococcus sp.]|nr:MAG: hypothetical protein DHS20C05_08610 [Marinicaulis sp.]
MRDPKDYQFDLLASHRPTEPPLNEKVHPVAWAAARHCTSARTGDPNKAIRAIVIHATAGASTSGAVSVMQEHRASFHWLIPDENEAAHGKFVWASAPESRAAWHVRNNCSHKNVFMGATRINDWSLGIEIVNTQQQGDKFSDWQIQACAEIIRYAWVKYPNLTHIVSHARLDPMRRTDPGANFPWEALEHQTLARTE